MQAGLREGRWRLTPRQAQGAACVPADFRWSRQVCRAAITERPGSPDRHLLRELQTPGAKAASAADGAGVFGPSWSPPARLTLRACSCPAGLGPGGASALHRGAATLLKMGASICPPRGTDSVCMRPPARRDLLCSASPSPHTHSQTGDFTSRCCLGPGWMARELEGTPEGARVEWAGPGEGADPCVVLCAPHPHPILSFAKVSLQ